MANTFSKIYLHYVFTPKGREYIISEKYREELQKYITGIVQNRNQKMLAIYCMPDHTHILIGYKPSISIPYLIRDIKTASTIFMNDKKWFIGKFQWQEGYGCFSYSHSQLDDIIQYINIQPEHHKRRKFKEEYLDILHKFDVKYNDDYLFEWYD